LFCNLFYRNGFEYDYVFDWTELKFLEYLKGMERLGEGLCILYKCSFDSRPQLLPRLFLSAT
jgi:hypothetical protein